MKKFLAVLLSAVLCAAVAYSACAEEAAPVEDTDVETETSMSVSDVVDALKNDEKAQKIANDLVEAVKTGATKKDVSDLLGALGSYVGNAGFDFNDLKDGGAVRDVLDMFLADAGVDSEELNDAISESKLANGILDIYYSAPVDPEPEPEVPVEPEDPIIPDTDFVG